MAKVADFFVELGLKKDKYDKGMQEATAAPGKMSSGFASAATAITAAFAVAGVAAVAFGKKAMQAYDQQAKAEAGLLLALGNRTAALKMLSEQASELQGKTLFGDEATMEAQRQLAVMKLTTQQIKDLTPLIQDFATVNRMDLVSAANLVAKAVGTQTNALGRYGVQLDSTMSMSEKAAEIQRILNERYGGQAEAAAAVGTGAMTQFSNAAGDLTEVLGKVLATNLSGFFKSATDELSKMGTMLNSEITPGWQKLYALLNPALAEEVRLRDEAYKKVTGSRTAAQQQLVDAQDILAQKKAELAAIRESNAEKEKARKIETDKAAAKAREEALKQAKELAQAHREGADAMARMANEMQLMLDKAVSEGFGGFEALETTDPYDLTESINAAIGDIEPIKIPIDVQNMNEQMLLIRDNTLQFVNDMNAAMEQLVEGMIAGFAEGFADLATGDASLDQFFSAILGQFGGFVSQMGKMIIAYGISMAAFKKAFSNPYVAIAAGAALVFIGKAISNMAAKGPAMSGGGAGTGGMSGGGYGSQSNYNSSGYGMGESKLVAEVKGSDLVFILERANNNLNRIRP